MNKCKVRSTTVGGKRVYGIVESTDRDCETVRSMRKKLRASKENVEVGIKDTTETVDLPAKFSESKISTGSNNSLRVAMLKTRFAETILKAQQTLMFSENNKAEKKRLERKKGDTEKDIRASKMLLLKQRQKERKIARLALENVKQTVFWNDAIKVEQELGKLIGCGIVQLTDHGSVADHAFRKKSSISEKAEKERLERKKLETETDIKDVEMVLKMQRQKEREMARLALENMKKTVVWNDALLVEQELEKLIGARPI